MLSDLMTFFKPTFVFKWIVKRKAAKVGNDLRVNGFSTVSKNTYLGNNVNFNGIKIIGRGKCTIGNNFHSGTMCQILTDYHNYDHGNAIPYDDTFIVKDVKIGDNVWIGNNVIILPGVTIGQGVVIQAGSVVVSNIPDLSVAGGHPAKVFKERDKDHYFRLKQQNLFH